MLRMLLAKFRRRVLTRCECCGLPLASQGAFAFGHEPADRWWRGDRGLYHESCMRLEMELFGWHEDFSAK